MRRLFHALSRKWSALSGSGALGSPYRIVCVCGQAVEGLRTARQQSIRCPGCREPLFVLPRSPLPPVEPDEGSPPPPAPPPLSWRVPLIAAGLTLALVAGGLTLLFSHLSSTPGGRSKNGAPPQSVEEAVAEARQLFAGGDYLSALQVLKKPGLSGDRSESYTRLLRQVELLAGLAKVPLQEMIRECRNQGDKAWEALFARDYAGRSLVFDDEVRQEANGRFRLANYEVYLGKERVEVQLELDLLELLPQQRRGRVLFGGKLSSLKEMEKVWVVEFEKKSGVLLTDEGVVRGLRPRLPIDGVLKSLLADQSAWERSRRE